MSGLDDALRGLAVDAVADAVAPLRRELRELRAAVNAGSARWLSRRQAAEMLGVSQDTIDRRVRDGSLRARTIGRRCLFLVEPPASEQEIARLATEARAPS